MIKALLASGKFKVTLLTRNLKQDPAPGTSVSVVDYEDIASVSKALTEQDAVVSTLSREASTSQFTLIDAAVATGVKRFIPSEFGANLQNENARQLINYQKKVQVEDYLEKKAKESDLTYTYIYTNVLMDWSIEARIILDFQNARAPLYDGGENPISMITTPAAARAVASVLTKLNETRNKAVCVHEAVMSQRMLLSHAKEVTPNLRWIAQVIDLQQLEEEARQHAKVGVPNMSMFHVGAMRGGFGLGYGNRFDGSDNELLGVRQMSEMEIKEFLRTMATLQK